VAPDLSGETLTAADALATEDQRSFEVRAAEKSELLLFDMA